jgi:hypothetical protein
MLANRCVTVVDDDWPLVKPDKSDVTIPEGSEFEIRVVPCGEDSWVPKLCIWPEEVGLYTCELEIEFRDCLDFSLIREVTSLSRFDCPTTLVRDVGVALANFLAEKCVFNISNTISSSIMEISLVSNFYESKCFCDFEVLHKALYGKGMTKEEVQQAETEFKMKDYE